MGQEKDDCGGNILDEDFEVFGWGWKKKHFSSHIFLMDPGRESLR